ncbi:MAG: hypothetical protein AAF360_18040 [Pseudomonadota bacterium]
MSTDIVVPFAPAARRIKDPALRESMLELDSAFSAFIADTHRLMNALQQQAR